MLADEVPVQQGLLEWSLHFTTAEVRTTLQQKKTQHEAAYCSRKEKPQSVWLFGVLLCCPHQRHGQGQMEDNIGVVMRNREHGRKGENETMVFEMIYIRFVAPPLGFLFVVSVPLFSFSLSDQA